LDPSADRTGLWTATERLTTREARGDPREAPNTSPKKSPENRPEALTSFRAANSGCERQERSPCKCSQTAERRSAPERIRTSGLRFRRPTPSRMIWLYRAKAIGPTPETRQKVLQPPRDALNPGLRSGPNPHTVGRAASLAPATSPGQSRWPRCARIALQRARHDEAIGRAIGMPARVAQHAVRHRLLVLPPDDPWWVAESLRDSSCLVRLPVAKSACASLSRPSG
jgi:hypothetical protein